MKPIYKISKKQLYQKYKIEKLSIIECSKYFGCSESPIQRLLKVYGIPYNTKSEMMKGKNAPWYGKKGKEHPQWKSIKRKCSWCGEKIIRKKCYDIVKHTFCSPKCHSRWLSKKMKGNGNPNFTSVLVKCDWCGKKKLVNQYRIKNQKHFFCSRKHQGLWKSENFRGDKIYNWKGGYDSYYGENWLVQRRKALERDNYTCQNKKCGKTKDDLGKNPDVHHKIPFSDFGLENYKEANELKNLISYCASCHSKIHNCKWHDE